MATATRTVRLNVDVDELVRRLERELWPSVEAAHELARGVREVLDAARGDRERTPGNIGVSPLEPLKATIRSEDASQRGEEEEGVVLLGDEVAAIEQLLDRFTEESAGLVRAHAADGAGQ